MRLMMDSSSPASSITAELHARRVCLRVSDEAPERQRIGVPIGDETRAGENERDLRALGQIRIELRDDGGRHVEGAVLFVQAVRRLDLAHLLARRHVDAERLPRRASLLRR